MPTTLRPNPSPASIDYFDVALTAARQQAGHVLAPIAIESLTIAPDVMPHHYVARAVIPDLQPEQAVDAIGSTMAAIRREYANAVRTGWRAASDGLYLYFQAWTPQPANAAGSGSLGRAA